MYVFAYMHTNFLQCQFFSGHEGGGGAGGAVGLPFRGAGVGGGFLGATGGGLGGATSSGEGCMTKKIDM